MRIYLDNSCLNRPFDDQSLLTIRLETEAKLGIQEKIKSGHLSLGWSYILDFENNANPCQYFLTVDKGILKKMTEYSEIKITNPVNFIIEWEAKQ